MTNTTNDTDTVYTKAGRACARAGFTIPQVEAVADVVTTLIKPTLDALHARTKQLEMPGTAERGAAGGLITFARGLGEDTRAFVLEKLAEAVAPVLQRLDALERRPDLTHAGAFKSGESYAAGTLVQHQGSCWLAKMTTSATPGTELGESRAWTLVAKRGVDGADSRELRGQIAALTRRLDTLEQERRR